MDGLVDVQVLEALRGQRFKPPLASWWTPLPGPPRRAHHEGLVEDVGDDGLVHPVAPPQQAFGQIRHRAAVAELKGHKGEGRMRGRRDRNAPVPKKGAESPEILFRRLIFLGQLNGGARAESTGGYISHAGFNLRCDD